MPRTLLRNPPRTSRRTAVTPKEWRSLCLKALDRARASGDRRAAGLEAALANRREQATLRSLGILSDVDLDREFSAPQTSTGTNEPF